MGEIVLLLAGAMILRLLGSFARISGLGRIVRVAGWIICLTAGWMVATAAGAWSPYAVPLLLALLGALAETRPGAAFYELWSSADAVVVIATGLLSIPLMELRVVVSVLLFVTIYGFLVDWALTHYSRPIHYINVLMLSVVGLSTTVIGLGML